MLKVQVIKSIETKYGITAHNLGRKPLYWKVTTKTVLFNTPLNELECYYSSLVSGL